MKKLLIFMCFAIAAGCIANGMSTSAPAVSTDDAVRLKELSVLPARQLFERGCGYQESGNADSALICFSILSNCYAVVSSADDKRLCALSLLRSGVLYYEQFNYAEAMYSFLDCQKICEDNGFEVVLADVYRAIGNIYSMNRDYERGIAFYEKSLRLAAKNNDNVLRLKALNNLVGACFFNGAGEEAGRYYAEMLKYPADDKLYHYDVLIDGGLLAAHSGDVEKAADSYRKAAEYAIANGMDVKKYGAAYSLLAMLYEKQGMADSVLYYLHLNEEAARKSTQNDLLTETLRNLSAIYRERGDLDKSLEYQSEYMELADSIFNQSEFNRLKNAEFFYELDRTNRVIDALNVEKRQKDMQISLQRYLLLGISAIVLVILVFTVVVCRQKKKLQDAYEALFSRNKENLENEKFYQKRLSELESGLADASKEQSAEQDNGARQQLSPQLYAKLRLAIIKALEQTDIICDPDFSVNRLAEIAGSNTSYVSRVINDVYGKNFRAVLTEYRIKESMQRLSDARYANFTIKAIAESVGYRSQSSFIAAFTKQTGMKPSVYQEMAVRCE